MIRCLKIKNYYLLLFILFFLSSPKKIIAQDAYFVPKGNVGFHRGGLYTDLQIGYTITDNKNTFMKTFDNIKMISIGIESNYFFKNDFRMTPKITLEYHKNFLIWAIQTRLYPAKNMDFKQASIQVCPQIGISAFALGHLSFGYSFGLNNRDITQDLGFQVNLGFNLITDDW